YQANACKNRNSKHPEVPSHHKRNEIVEGKLGPLIESALERHQAIEEDYCGGERKIEREDCQHPEDVLLITEFSCPAHPYCSDHENDLSQDQIEKTEFFFEDGAPLLDVALEIRDVLRVTGLIWFSSQVLSECLSDTKPTTYDRARSSSPASYAEK